MGVNYRPDIDGLRAVAVICVVVSHAFPDFLPGGFVGVDIFFVISGFLISTIVMDNLSKNRFSLVDFYSRRIRRLFPSLLLVILSVLLIGWFSLLADEYKQLGKHVAGGAGFVSNFILINESGYFDNSSDTKPLMHLWSLCVEEQFYIIWPFLLLVFYKAKLCYLKCIMFIAILSFSYSVNSVDTISTFFTLYSLLGVGSGGLLSAHQNI